MELTSVDLKHKGYSEEVINKDLKLKFCPANLTEICMEMEF